MGRLDRAIPLDDNGATAGREIDAFGFDLYGRLDSKGNLCVSPTSIALALAMLRPGAKGITASQLDQVLHSLGSPDQNRALASLLESFSGDTVYDDNAWYMDHPDASPDATPNHATMTPAVELQVSNQAFVQKGMNIEPAYLDDLYSGFGAGLGLLDFSGDPEGARAAINKWASDRTHGRIPEVLHEGDIDASTRFALANAVFLHAGWTNQFDPLLTKSLAFTTRSGKSVSVPTMAQTEETQYAAGKGYRAVDLSFTGSPMNMTIIVPDDMAGFQPGFDANKLKAIDSAMSTYEVNLTLPRFSIESRLELSSVLAAMGLTDVFSERANLSGISAQPLSVSGVIHQANIDVVEEGTTAAAVTVITGATAGPGGDDTPKATLHVDKPFIYVIRDGSGAILFMGRVDDPSLK